MSEVKLGLLGAGFVSEFYMQGLMHVPGQKVKIVYSRTEKRAKSFAQKWHIDNWTTDIHKVLEDPEVDLVIIGLPNFLHKDAAVLAAKASKNVVCTKPLARNAQEAKEMLDAVKKAGVIHGYAETEVFSPAVMKAREIIEKGAIGEPFWVRSREAHFGPHSPWFWDVEKSGGGALLDMGCHCIEAARYFFGKENKVLEVMAWGSTIVHKDKTKGEDNAILIMKFENDKVGQTEVSWSSRGGLDLRNEIYGTMGVIFTDVTRGTAVKAFTLKGAGYVLEKFESDTGWIFPVVDEARIYGYHEEMLHFVNCVKKGEMPRETFEDGYIVNVILDTAYKSMKSGKWEKVVL